MTKVIVGIASIPQRVKELGIVVERVSDQCDKVVVALNSYTEIPSYMAKFSNVECHLTDNMLYGDAGKFLTVSSQNGYYISLDDDLLVPHTFCKDIIKGIDLYDGCVSFHGKVYNPFKTFKKPTKVYPCLRELDSDKRINFIGSGCAGFHTDRLKLSVEMFKLRNMADVFLSQQCHLQGVQMIALAHKRDYFTYLSPQGCTIWESFRGATPIQDAIMRTFL